MGLAGVAIALIAVALLLIHTVRMLSDAGSRHSDASTAERVWREDAAELHAWDRHLASAMDTLVGAINESPDDPLHVPAPAERARVRGAWIQVVDTAALVQQRVAFHRDFVLVVSRDRRAAHIRSFLLCDVGDLIVQDAGLRLADAIAARPAWRGILNEPEPSLGLESQSYDFLRGQVHSPERFSRQVAAGAWLAALRRTRDFPAVADDVDSRWLVTRADELHASVAERYRVQGMTYTARETKDYTAGIARELWFPVQMNVANTMGNVKVRRQGEYLIAPETIREVRARLLPGDIGVTRKSWYLSNAGIPGFWPHAVLHLGTVGELSAFLDEAEVHAWVQSQDPDADDFCDLLRRRYPAAWDVYSHGETTGEARARGVVVGDHPDDELLFPAFIESIAPGVVIRLAEETLAADYALVLRPRLPRVDIAIAIERAFSHAGKPYDYDFDFRTDHQLVCSELVYKAYQPDATRTGLRFALDETLGRPLLPPTWIVRQFDEELDTPDSQLDFVVFLDARESDLASFESTREQARASWRRPKWYDVVY